MSKPSRKTRRFIKLQFIDKVVDISVDMQRSLQTVLNTVEGAQVQLNDKLVDVQVEMNRKFTQSVPCRKPRKSHIRPLTGIPEILMQVPVIQEMQKDQKPGEVQISFSPYLTSRKDKVQTTTRDS